MSAQPVVRRIRRASDASYNPTEQPPQAQGYRGFGSIRGETLEEFHDRMFDIDPLEAMIYEMEVALQKAN